MNVVIIKEDGTFYFTIAVAIHYDGKNGNNVEYFILNEDDEFEMVHEFYKNKDGRLVEKRVLFNDVYKRNEDIIWVGNYYGYKRFVNDRKLLNRIRNGEKDIFSKEDMIFYQSMKYSRNGINTIVDDMHSCKVLYNLCDFFKGATIEHHICDDNNKHITLIIGSLWGMKQLKLDFYDVEKYNIVESEDPDDFCLICSLFYEGGKVCFVSDECSSIDELWDGWTYVICKRIEYYPDFGIKEA